MDLLDFPESGQFEALIAYWLRLRDDAGGVPSRTALDPIAIKDLLPFVFLVERRDPTDLHVRLSGTALDAVTPEPMTGLNYLDLCPAHLRAFLQESATAVCDQPCGHRYKRRVTRAETGTHEVTTLALPMTDRHGEMRYLLGMMSAKAEVLVDRKPPAGDLLVDVLSADFVDLGFGVPDPVPAP